MWEETNSDLILYLFHGKVHRLSSTINKIRGGKKKKSGGREVIKHMHTPRLGYFFFILVKKRSVT